MYNLPGWLVYGCKITGVLERRDPLSARKTWSRAGREANAGGRAAEGREGRESGHPARALAAAAEQATFDKKIGETFNPQMAHFLMANLQTLFKYLNTNFNNNFILFLIIFR